MERYDVVVIGAGIVGVATAHALTRGRPGVHVAVLEKETAVATHQTGRNSGVVHSGIYYPPGSMKARLVAAARQPLIDVCAAHAVPLDFPGKVIVATSARELPALDVLFERGVAHGLRVRRLCPAELRELEPHARGIGALHVPETGRTDFAAVARALAAEVASAGGDVRLTSAVTRVGERRDSVVVSASTGDVVADVVVVCAGLHGDRLTDTAGDTRIVPFRGDYYSLREPAASLVRSMVYPVPDPRFPFLGVHLTRGVGGAVHAGPSAVLALSREGYYWRDVDRAAVADLVRFPGTRRLAARHWRTGLAEIARSLSRAAFARAVQRLVPEVTADALVRAPAGVRAQALRRDGTLVDDFAFRESRRVVHVVNAPSPAATAGLAIGRHVADVVGAHLDDR